MQVNATVGRLVTLTQRLRTELDNLTDQVEQLRSGCNAASLAVCNRIPMIRYTVNVNYDVVRMCVHECVPVLPLYEIPKFFVLIFFLQKAS